MYNIIQSSFWTNCFILKDVEQAGMLQEPLTAVCCFSSMLWKLKIKLCAIMPGAVQMHVSPFLKETIVKKNVIGISRSFSLFSSIHVVSSIFYLSVLSTVFSSVFTLSHFLHMQLLIFSLWWWQFVLYAVFSWLFLMTELISSYAIVLSFTFSHSHLFRWLWILEFQLKAQNMRKLNMAIAACKGRVDERQPCAPPKNSVYFFLSVPWMML